MYKKMHKKIDSFPNLSAYIQNKISIKAIEFNVDWGLFYREKQTYKVIIILYFCFVYECDRSIKYNIIATKSNISSDHTHLKQLPFTRNLCCNLTCILYYKSHYVS